MPEGKQLVLRSWCRGRAISFDIKGKDTDPSVLSGSVLVERLVLGGMHPSCMWQPQQGRSLEM